MIGLYVFLVVIIVYFLFFNKSSKKNGSSNLPPGPKPLPIRPDQTRLAHQIDYINMHQTFDKWSEEFGKIVYAELLGRQMVILNSFDAVKEALVKQGDNFAARPEFWIFEQQSGGKGYVISQGDLWKEQRRHGLHVLRDMGLGRSLQEEKIISETAELFAEFDGMLTETEDSHRCGILSPVETLKFAVVNIINNILFGNRFMYGDQKFKELQHHINSLLTSTLRQMPMEFMPILRSFSNLLFHQDKSIVTTQKIMDHFRDEITKHQSGLESDLASGAPSDFVYAYLGEIKRRDNQGENLGSFSVQQLEQNLLDLFTAGFETTATTLSWFIIYMVNYPEVQEKMRKEILLNVGSTPSLSDKVNLPYCCAVVTEVQRHASIVPFGVFHSCYEDATVLGYHVPKGCIVVPNQWTVMKDETLFANPLNFDPDRFIQTDGSFSEKMDGLLPFSLGKRACMGESLARMELFLFATAMVTRYAMKPAPEGRPSMEAIPQFTLAPRPFRLELELLQSN